MPIELTGECTDARIMVDDESLIEDNCVEQIQTLIDHAAFTEPVRIVPDAHVGAGAPVGFSMALPDRVVPNIVGVDVGCGMAATNLGDRTDGRDHGLSRCRSQFESQTVTSLQHHSMRRPDPVSICFR